MTAVPSPELRLPARRPRHSLASALALLSIAGLATAQQAPKDQKFDPSMGIDEDGRIERPKLPDDLPNKARWRYVPEGRIVPGNPIERLWSTSFVAPIIFAEPDVGFGGGVAITDIDFRNQRRQEFAGIFLSYTTEGQQSYRIAWRRYTNHIEADGGGILQDERSYWLGSGGYQKTLTRRFYGLGADTTLQDQSSYSDEVTAAAFGRQWTLFEPAGDWIAQLGGKAEYHNLAEGAVTGIPSTDQAYPLAFDDGDGRGLLWLNAALEYNTRDSQHSPHRGTTIGLGVNVAPLQDDGSVGALFGAEATQVVPIPSPFHDGGDGNEENPPTDTLAFSLATNTTSGDLPFYLLPSLGGGNTLRGYINNRWTDRSSWHASAEYRFWFVPRGFQITDRIRIERIGAALFYDVGSVADQWSDLFSSTVRTSYGFGLRFHLERLALFRVDFGFSEEDTNFTISYGLPF